MKKLFCILLLMLLLLVGCVSNSPKEESLPAYSDPIGEYDTVSTVMPEDGESSENTEVSSIEGSQTEQTENGFSVKYKKYDLSSVSTGLITTFNLTKFDATDNLKVHLFKERLWSYCILHQ